jgi:hypothetical protein
MASESSDIEHRALLASIEGEGLGRGNQLLVQGVAELWYSLIGRAWATLAVVAPDNAPRAWWLAQRLAEVGKGEPGVLKAVNVLKATVARAAAIGQALSPQKLKGTAQRKRFILAVDSPLENPVAIGLLSGCDAVLLLLELERTRIPDGQRIIELVGRERFVGAVLGSWSGSAVRR